VLIVAPVLAIYFFSIEIGQNNPEVYGVAYLKWTAVEALIFICCFFLFPFITFTKNGIRTSGSITKVYYSELTTFELSDESLSYTTNSGKKYEARIMKPNTKTKQIIQTRIEKQKNTKK
jgi:hypothetical protein